MVPAQLVCQSGHEGPWLYVEAIEVWREVRSVTAGSLTVDSQWHTGDGYDDGVEGSAYLLCWATDSNGYHCANRVELPADAVIDWD